MSYLQNFKYELSGRSDAPKIVFLHGVMGSAANWRKITPAFQSQFQVLTYDQRGHGGSFKPDGGYSPSDYAEDLRLILNELQWERVVLVGHSMGGRNVLQFAHAHPDRLLALVIEDIGPQGNPEAMQKTLNLVEMVPVPFANKQEAKDYLMGEFVDRLSRSDKMKGEGGRKAAVVLAQYFYTNIEQQKDGTADWRFSKPAVLESLRAGHAQERWEIIRQLQMPTLFVRGEKSEDFSHKELQRVLAANPRIQGVEIAGAGHWVHFDQPERFIHEIMGFLQGHMAF